jgi:hypothetical protein
LSNPRGLFSAGQAQRYRRTRFAVRAIGAWISYVGLFAVLVACGGNGDAVEREQAGMQQKTIEAVLQEHTDALMSLPGVVGTAQGECVGEPCIKVYVVREIPDLLEQIPAAIEGYQVVVEETGEIHPRP